MSTSTKGGDTTTKRVKVSKDNTEAHFTALQAFQNEMQNKTVRDSDRIPHLVTNLLGLSDHYIPTTDKDKIHVTTKGYPSFKGFKPCDLVMTKRDWEGQGLKRGALPSNTIFDPVSQDYKEVSVTINGIEIDTTDDAVIRKFQLITSFPPSVMHDAMEVIETVFNKHFDDSS